MATSVQHGLTELSADPARRTRPLGSDLDLETDLDDLRYRHPEVGGRKMGTQVHRCEQRFAPLRHACRLTARDNHDPPEVMRTEPRLTSSATCSYTTKTLSGPGADFVVRSRHVRQKRHHDI